MIFSRTARLQRVSETVCRMRSGHNSFTLMCPCRNWCCATLAKKSTTSTISLAVSLKNFKKLVAKPRVQSSLCSHWESFSLKNTQAWRRSLFLSMSFCLQQAWVTRILTKMWVPLSCTLCLLWHTLSPPRCASQEHTPSRNELTSPTTKRWTLLLSMTRSLRAQLTHETSKMTWLFKPVIP